MSHTHDKDWRKWAKRQGARIRTIRKARGLMTKDVAAKSGIDRTALIRLERGDYGPLVYSILLLSKALEVTLDQIVEPLGK